MEKKFELPEEVVQGLVSALNDFMEGKYTILTKEELSKQGFCKCKGLEPRSSVDMEKGKCVNCGKFVKKQEGVKEQ